MVSSPSVSLGDGEAHPETSGFFSNPEEQRVFVAALDSFRQYRRYAHYNVTHRRRKKFYALPTAQWQMLAGQPFKFLETLERVDDAIDANADIADQIVATTLQTMAVGLKPGDWHEKATPDDMDKARSTIQQFYRDWSAEGVNERQACYGPIRQSLDAEFGQIELKNTIKILVPGAGLGRLLFDLCHEGFSVEGNEISYHQLLASNWVLNYIPRDRRYGLHPFALDFMNVAKRSHQLRSVEIPDVHPATALAASDGRMNMTCGDFLSAYAGEEYGSSFGAVVTAFFIDTAPNVIRYIETIWKCLVPGGIWVNSGPLLWHFSEKAAPLPDGKMQEDEAMGIEAPGSFELTNEELVLLVERLGFEVEQSRILDEAQGYIQNAHSMLQHTFRSSFWVARKREKKAADG